jgi:hypothetical protein
MSYVPGFAPDGQADWRELDVDLQERVLDEVDRIAASPPSSPAASLLTDIVVERSGAKHYVWIRYVVNHTAMSVTVIGITHYVRPLTI